MQNNDKKYFIPVDGTLSRSARRFTGHTTSPFEAPATMPRGTTSAAAPRRSFGSATVFAPAARSTLPVRRFPSIRLSAARKTSLPLATRWPTTHRLRSPSLWTRNCSTLYTTSLSCRARRSVKSLPPALPGAEEKHTTSSQK